MLFLIISSVIRMAALWIKQAELWEDLWFMKPLYTTDTRRLTTGLRSEKWVVTRFCCCANVVASTYTNLDSITYCTPSL
jgi:hypothetical protein